MWVTACQVFIDEISTLRSLRPAWASHVPAQGERELLAVFDRGLSAMTAFSVTGPLISKLFLIAGNTCADGVGCRISTHENPRSVRFYLKFLRQAPHNPLDVVEIVSGSYSRSSTDTALTDPFW